MSAAEVLLPEQIARAATVLAPETAARVDAWATQLAAVLADVRSTRPAEGSEEERTLLERYAILNLSLIEILADRYRDVMESVSLDRITELTRRELAESSPERKLAARFLVTAFEAMAELHAYVLRLQAELSAEDHRTLTRMAREGMAIGMPFGDDARALSRWQLDLLVALGCLDFDEQELAFWSRRALAGSRNARAWLATSAPTSFLGLVARARTDLAWRDWSDDDLATELAPWPTR